MSHKVAAIDVHKRMLAVVIADIAEDGEYQFERRKFSAAPADLHLLAQWLDQQEVEEVVMESTAQYWRPVWGALERYWKPSRQQRPNADTKSGALHLCLAKSNRGRRGRKSDFLDCERMLKRFAARELVMSYVPDPEQRLWRTVTRRKYQLNRARVAFQNQLESLLEQGHIKLSSLVSDLLGVSARRMLEALAKGEAHPAALAALADRRLRATAEQLRDALGACTQLTQEFRDLLKLILEELQLLEAHIEKLDRMAMELLKAHRATIQRVSEIPGLGPSAAVQLIAELGPDAAAFATSKEMASWVGVCPGDEESAGKSKSSKSPKGNRHVRRLLNQAAHSAVKVKGSIFEVAFRRLLSRIKYQEAIWAIAHRICRLLWIVLRRGVAYEERGPAVSAKSKRDRASRLIRELAKLGVHVVQVPPPTSTQA